MSGDVIRFSGPNEIDHVQVWAGISKRTHRPVYGVDYVFGDGGHANMSLRDDLSVAMDDARACADGKYPIRDGEP